MRITFVWLLLTLLFSTSVDAQGYNNKFSIDLALGGTNAVKPYSTGYWSNTIGFFHANAGGRYMFSNKFGLSLDAGFDRIKNDEIGWFTNTGYSLPFRSKYYRSSLQVVFDLGRIFAFENFSEKTSLLFHTGGGMSLLTSKINPYKDKILNFMFGMSPQFKINDRVAIYLDASFIWHIYQQYTWDMHDYQSIRGFNGFIANASVGTNIYFGKHATHMDWAFSPCFPDMTYLEEENKKLDSTNRYLRYNLKDDDGDGIVNFIDDEKNTLLGNAVNCRGVSLKNIDSDGDGVSDFDDRCIDIPGKKDFNGCPEDVLIALKNNDSSRVDIKTNPKTNPIHVDSLDENGNPNYIKDTTGKGNSLVAGDPKNGNNSSGGNTATNGGNQNNAAGGNNATNGGNTNNSAGGNNATNGGNTNNTAGGNNATNGGNQNNSGGRNNATNGGKQNNSGGGNNATNVGNQNNTSGGNNNTTNANNNPNIITSMEGLRSLTDINFELEDASIQYDLYPLLKEVVALLKANPNMVIVLEGHADNTGSDQYNLNLSEKRIAALKKYFISQGIKEPRIKTAAFGESKPKFLNSTPYGRSLNRRVELYIKEE